MTYEIYWNEDTGEWDSAWVDEPAAAVKEEIVVSGPLPNEEDTRPGRIYNGFVKHLSNIAGLTSLLVLFAMTFFVSIVTDAYVWTPAAVLLAYALGALGRAVWDEFFRRGA